MSEQSSRLRMHRSMLHRRNLVHHWRSHLAVMLGVLAGSAALTGALLVGDSLRGSLRTEALDRLGAIDHVLRAPAFFRQALADDLVAAAAPVELHVAPVILLRGSATHAGTRAAAARVNALGVDSRFGLLAAPGSPTVPMPDEGNVVLNGPLAAELGARVGEALLLRVGRPAAVSPETLLGRRDAAPVTMRLTVSAITPAAGLGAFALDSQQRSPRNAFVSLPALQRVLNRPERTNALLVAGAGDDDTTNGALAVALRAAVTLADLGLRLRVDDGGGYVALESDSLLLSPPVEAAARRAAASIGCPAAGLLAYLANSIALADMPDRSIPYSTVVAIEPVAALLATLPRATGGPLAPGEMLLNDWAAADLDAKVGDLVDLAHYQAAFAATLETRSARFRLAGIVALDGGAADRHLVPDYPGVTDTDRITDWDPPFPIDLKRIRDRDEAYWDSHRATPKAFILLEDGQRLWAQDADRFGRLTSLRIYVPPGDSLDTTRQAFEVRLRRELDVRNAGLAFDAVRRRALAASQGTTDFAGLFIGFSFFLIASAAMLVALLFRLGVERRSAEIGLLLATGFAPGRVLRLLLAEGFVVAGVGTALGLVAARGYAWLMLAGLRSWWFDAVHAPFLALHTTPQSYAIGGIAGLAVAVLAIAASLRGLARHPPRVLLAGPIASGGDSCGGHPRRARVATGVSVAALLSAAGFVAASWWGAALPEATAFFAGGAALLAAGLAALAAWLANEPWSSRQPGAAVPLVRQPGSAVPRRVGRGALLRLGVRNARRHRGRSLATAALIALAAFVITALQSLRLTPPTDVTDRQSGTGGFALLAETDVPLLHDLNTAEGRAALNMTPEDAAELAGVTSYPFRLRSGDETSCLNLYRPTQPRLLGATDAMIDRGGFMFAATQADDDTERRNPWLLLRRPLADGAVPAIADEAAARWQLHLDLGDTLVVKDERGADVPLRLVALLKGSVLQGEIILREADFTRLYPSVSGYAVHLMEAPLKRSTRVEGVLEWSLSDFGLAVTPTAQRLADLQAVQNTYLSTFQTLGGLGLLLGVLGLTAVMLRNVDERRGELALLRALGFAPRALGLLVLVENVFLVVAGLGIGVVSAALIVAPHVVERGAPLPWASLLGLFAVILLAGLAAGVAALVPALRTPLLPALRSE